MSDFKKIECGLDLLISADGYLLEKDINERAITHKLAEHIQKLYPDWNVDCEFNKNLDEIKEITIDHHQLLLEMSEFLENTPNLWQLIDEEIPEEFRLDLSRQLRDQKNIEYIEELDLWLFLWKKNGTVTKHKIYPDIIIHSRGKTQNHIVFEAKKTSNRSKEDRIFDFIKLATLVYSPEYKYKKGVFIVLPVGHNFTRHKSFQRNRSVFKQVYKYSSKQ